MKAVIGRKIKQLTQVWHELILPGALIVGLVVLARLAGVLQVQELIAFDDFLRLRPPVTPAPRVVIVGIDEADLNKVGGIPVPDRDLASGLYRDLLFTFGFGLVDSPSANHIGCIWCWTNYNIFRSGFEV